MTHCFPKTKQQVYNKSGVTYNTEDKRKQKINYIHVITTVAALVYAADHLISIRKSPKKKQTET